MKKLLLLFIFPLMLVGCAKEPAETLSSLPIDINGQSSSSQSSEQESSNNGPAYHYVKLTPENSGLTNDDSTEIIPLTLDSSVDNSVKYELAITNPCYLHAKFHEFVVKPGACIFSMSEYTVDRLIIDFYGEKGVFFDVYDNNEGKGAALEYHSSTYEPEDSDGGMVYEYSIQSSGWCIKNNTEFNKPGFYSITVIFLV